MGWEEYWGLILFLQNVPLDFPCLIHVALGSGVGVSNYVPLYSDYNGLGAPGWSFNEFQDVDSHVFMAFMVRKVEVTSNSFFLVTNINISEVVDKPVFEGVTRFVQHIVCHRPYR